MSVKGFDTFEEMQAYTREEHAKADAAVEPWQTATKPGDCYVELEDDGVMIYGEVREEVLSPNEPPLAVGNHRFVCGYSRFAPNGELGYRHVAGFGGLITREQFETARRLGWPATIEEFKQLVADDPRWVSA